MQGSTDGFLLQPGPDLRRVAPAGKPRNEADRLWNISAKQEMQRLHVRPFVWPIQTPRSSSTTSCMPTRASAMHDIMHEQVMKENEPEAVEPAGPSPTTTPPMPTPSASTGSTRRAESLVLGGWISDWGRALSQLPDNLRGRYLRHLFQDEPRVIVLELQS